MSEKKFSTMDKIMVLSSMAIVGLLLINMFFTEEKLSHDLIPEQIGWYSELYDKEAVLEHKHVYLIMTPHGVEKVVGFADVAEKIEIYMETYVYGLTVDELEEIRRLETEYINKKHSVKNGNI